MSICLNLIPYGKSFDLAKDFILDQMPEGPLAQALHCDPNATSIDIPNVDVTPDAMQDIVNLSHGIEPDRHNPDLIQADLYFNMHKVLNYTHPLYDQIQRNNIAAVANSHVFLEAINKGLIWVITYLLSKGFKPLGGWAVSKASGQPNTNIVRILLEIPDIDLTNSADQILYNAIREGPLETVKLLLADPRIEAALNYNIALYMAAKRGWGDVVTLLTAKVSLQGLQDAFNIAAKYGHIKVVKIFLAIPMIHLIENELLDAVARMGQAEVMQVLLADSHLMISDRNTYISKYDSALVMAAGKGHASIVQMLMAIPNVNPAAFSNQAIYEATVANHFDTVKLLLMDQRVDPEVGFANSFHTAIRQGNVEMVDLFMLDSRVHPEINDNEALTLAVKFTTVTIVERILVDVRVRTALLNKINPTLAEWIRIFPNLPTSQLIQRYTPLHV